MLLEMPTENVDELLSRHPFNGKLVAPQRKRVLRELGGVWELYKLWQRRAILPDLKSAQPETVLVIPGLFCFDFLTFMTRWQLYRAGHESYGWQMGINWGNTDKSVPKLVHSIKQLVEKHGRPVVLMGWSLGGVMAREITRQHPDLVKMVMTFGAPIVGGPKFTVTDWWYNLQNIDIDQMERELMSQYAVPIERPIVAYYSKNDSVIDWRACIDPYSPNVEHIEVDSTHFGMGFSAEIIQHMLKTLQIPASVPSPVPIPNG